MKIKKLVGMLMCGVLLANTIPANAFTNSCAGDWQGVVGVKFNYNSDGTLVIKGETGSEIVDNSHSEGLTNEQELRNNFSIDVKSIIVDNVDYFGLDSTNSQTFYTSHSIDYVSINATTVGRVFQYQDTISTIVFGDKVRRIEEAFIGSYNDDEVLTIYIPSTVEYINEKAINFSGFRARPKFNIVCEYGTAGYNWATYLKNNYTDKDTEINIELYETQATSQVVIDNRALYEIVVPENTTFKYTSDGWVADTFCGVVGTLPEGLDLTIKTDETFRVIGDEIIAVENVSTTTEDSLSSTANGIITTTLDKATLDSKPHEIQINDTTTEQGYKVDYKCKTQSPHLMKQSYSGVIKFLIN